MLANTWTFVYGRPPKVKTHYAKGWQTKMFQNDSPGSHADHQNLKCPKIGGWKFSNKKTGLRWKAIFSFLIVFGLKGILYFFSLFLPVYSDFSKWQDWNCFHPPEAPMFARTPPRSVDDFLLQWILAANQLHRLLRQLILHLLWQCPWNNSYGISRLSNLTRWFLTHMSSCTTCRLAPCLWDMLVSKHKLAEMLQQHRSWTTSFHCCNNN